MKKLIPSLFVFAALIFIQAKPYSPADSGIVFFQGTWEEALKKAEKEDKLIFLDAYASWCGPCKLLKRNVFTDPVVGEYFNANFINFEMDMERGEGPKVAQKYEVSAYPTLLFVDGSGDILKKGIGYHPQERLIQLGKAALNDSNKGS